MPVRAANIRPHSVVDGPGARTAVFFQGCVHRCKGCHSHALWPFDGGVEVTVGEVLCEIGHGLAEGDVGVTLTGGDPLCQPEAAAALCVALKGAGVHTIMYTGFVYEDLLEIETVIPAIGQVLDAADVLVDGPYVQGLDDGSLPYRGSTNQRIIDLPATRRDGQVVTLNWPPAVSILPDGSVVIPTVLEKSLKELGPSQPARACGQESRPFGCESNQMDEPNN
ncbi:MAG: radical SAM protein [Ardenticatenia bacterium]|nr:radical SAM protein [Ardenticatenia bacterium]